MITHPAKHFLDQLPFIIREDIRQAHKKKPKYHTSQNRYTDMYNFLCNYFDWAYSSFGDEFYDKFTDILATYYDDYKIIHDRKIALQ